MTESLDLEAIFQSVQRVMEQNRLTFNQADTFNGNHGDHMVEIFNIASQAAAEKTDDGLADAMDYAAELLQQMSDNESAQVYALGLVQLAGQFRKYDLDLADLLTYVYRVMKTENGGEKATRSGDIIRAFITALAGWQQVMDNQEITTNPLGLSYMFDLGVAYAQARQRNTTRAETIADTAASVSPLNSIPYRYESGRQAILALLLAMAE